MCARAKPRRTDLRALSGKVVVTPRTGPLAAFIRKNAPAIKLEVTEDYESSLERLVNGTADAAALNVQAGAMIANKLYPGKVSGRDRRCSWNCRSPPPCCKGQNADFVARLNAGLAAIRADGTFERINKSWIGQ